MPMAHVVEPCLIVETHRIDHQSVSLPMADRVSHPTGIRVFWMATPIQIHCTMAGDIILEDHHQTRWSLNQLIWKQDSGRCDTSCEAVRSRSVFVVIRDALLVKLLRPRQRFWFAWIHGPLRIPDAGQVWFTIPGARCRPGGRRMWS